MTIEVSEVTGPAFLASALVNGDVSDLDDDDLKVLERFTTRLGDWYVVGVKQDEDGESQEPRFTWHYKLHGGDAQGGSVIDYIIHRIIK